MPPIIDELCSAPGNQDRHGSLKIQANIAIKKNSAKIVTKISVNINESFPLPFCTVVETEL